MLGHTLSFLLPLLGVLERTLEVMIAGYDVLIYGPLQKSLSPVVAKIPRRFSVFERNLDIFTANNVTFARTILVIPIGLCMKYGCGYTACGLVVFHDFLDHLDGIVAKTQRKIYGPIDDPLLGGYLDAVCDKILFFFVMAAIFMVAPLHHMTVTQLSVFVGICSVILAYEVILGIVRTTDYYEAHYHRHHHGNMTSSGVAASMAGKLKEKLIAISEALLCLAAVRNNPMDTTAGMVAMVTLSLSIWFAHKSLKHKLEMRKVNKTRLTNGGSAISNNNKTSVINSAQFTTDRVDRVFTVGCFDVFHQGHINMLTEMRRLGKQVIVGVHSNESVLKLKNLVPTDNLETRMENIKKFADQVFVVWGTDPSLYMKCAFHVEPGERALYVRGDDMPDFPGRKVCEELMQVKLVPYTKGISSTLIRAKLRHSTLHVE
jgi:cytidyltransferase-like protein